MMTSDEERHEVARKLRVLACTPDEIGITEHAVIRGLGISAGIYDDCCRREDVIAIADLIDRPTCYVVEHKTHCGSYGCEEAGQLWVLSCGDECVNDSDFPPSYCPECGAMVFEKKDER